MKKQPLLVLLCLCLAQATFAQAKASYSEEIPETASITDKLLANPEMGNFAVAYIAHGLTIFKQTKELYLIDKNSLTVTNKILYPKFEGYDAADDLPQGSMKAMNGGELLLYKKKINKRYEIAGVKITGSFSVAASPTTIFTCKDPSNVKCECDDSKNICVFSSEEKVQKQYYFFYWVVDNNMKLLRHDSVAFNYETEIMSIVPLENGYALGKSGAVFDLTYVSFKTNKTTKVSVPAAANKFFNLAKAKSLAADKVILCGNYFYAEKKNYKNGVFKLALNPAQDKLDEQLTFENVPSGKYEVEKEAKRLTASCIDDNGNCYVVLNQQNFEGVRHKMELFGISGSTKWKRQLPMPGFNNPKFKFPMFMYKGELYISYTDFEADKPVLDYFDYNKYEYGNPLPSETVTARQTYRGHTTILAVSPNGTIRPQHLVGVTTLAEYMGGGTLMGIYQGLNGQITSKCKIVKVELN